MAVSATIGGDRREQLTGKLRELVRNGSVLVPVFVLFFLYSVAGVFAQEAAPKRDGSKQAGRPTAPAQNQANLPGEVKKLHQSLATAEKSGDLKAQYSVLSKLAQYFESRNDRGQAVQFLDRCLDTARKMGDRQLQSETLTRLENVYSKMRFSPKALEDLQALASLRKEQGDSRGEARTYAELGNLLRDAGRLDSAGEFYKKVLETGARANDPGLESDALIHLGSLSILEGRYKVAIGHLEKAVAVAEKHGDLARTEVAYLNLGYAFKASGKYAECAACLDKALNLTRQTQNTVTEALLLTYIGELYSAWGQHSRAELCYREALALAVKLGDKSSEARNLVRIAECQQQKGESGKALETIQLAVEAGRSAGGIPKDDKERVALLFLDLNALDKAEPLVMESGSPALMGRLCLAQGKYEAAREQYQRLLATAEEQPDLIFAARTGLGRACEALSDYAAAENHYSTAAEATETLRKSLLPFERRTFLDVSVLGFSRTEPTRGLTRVLMKQGQWEKSIVSSELARARAFADRLAVGPDRGYSGVPKPVQDEEQDLAATLAALIKLRSCCTKEEDPQRYETLTREIDKAQQKLDEFVDILWRDYPHYAAVKYPRPVKLEDLTVSDDTYLIMFDALGEGVGVKLLKGKQVIAADYRKWDSGELQRSIAAFREPFESLKPGKFDPVMGRRLYEELLATVLAKVPNGTPLTIIPDGVLAELPFEALVMRGEVQWTDGKWGKMPTGLTYVGDIYPVGYFQSLTALALSQTARQREAGQDRSVLVVADPVFDEADARATEATEPRKREPQETYVINLMTAVIDETDGRLRFPRLPETGALAQDLGKLYGPRCSAYEGLRADKKVFFTEVAPTIDRFSSVVFATHGVYANDIPGIMEPFLVMTTVPSGTDGFLRMTEVMSLAMNAEVVALVACQTGRGRYLSGEGVASMGRAFQYAGARSVLVSLWSVEEKASVTLVKSFFRYLSEGKNKMDALRSARSDIRTAGYEHPLFWAAFILVGPF